MNPQPFTYQHFILAFQGCKDNLLSCYIDMAIGIYCTLKGVTVGARPKSFKDYSTRYADAYEVALNAVYTVFTKIGAYNPPKGIFKPYLHRALENAIKDILEADGKGDFFDQTSKKKKGGDEPEKHSRVNVDTFYGAAEPDDTETKVSERVRTYEDQWIETIISYVDSLPKNKRDAIYASAFGQALRPDLIDYGRNYAEELAQKYNTTARYIRKMAADGKKAALEEAQRLGYNERAKRQFSMELIQVKKAPNIHDMVIEASQKLTPYQQFKFMLHMASKIEELEK